MKVRKGLVVSTEFQLDVLLCRSGHLRSFPAHACALHKSAS